MLKEIDLRKMNSDSEEYKKYLTEQRHRLADLLSSSDNEDSVVRHYTREARQYGFGIDRPSINMSTCKCITKHGGIILPLGAIAGISDQMCHTIVAERNANGRFTSYSNFCDRVAICDQSRENLIKAGAFDELHYGIEFLQDVLPGASNVTQVEAVLMTSTVLGSYVTIRSFDRQPQAYRYDMTNVAAATELPVGSIFRTLGYVYNVHEHQDRRGKTMAFISISDDENYLPVTIFANMYDITISIGDNLHLVCRVDQYGKSSYKPPEISRIVNDYEVVTA